MVVRPDFLYTAAQVRELENYAISEFAIDSYTLMTRAAEAVVRLLRFRWPKARSVAIVCGTGNNGGDGLVVARMLKAGDIASRVSFIGDPRKLRGDAKRAFRDFVGTGGEFLPIDECLKVESCDVIVDALFGSGLSRSVAGEAAAAVEMINRHKAPVIAVDVPSGICADTGAIRGVGVNANITITLVGRKRGLYTARGPDHAGAVFFDGLQLPEKAYSKGCSLVERVRSVSQAPKLPPRLRSAHKGRCGRVLCVGGNVQYGGAISLAAYACLRMGAGLLTIARHPASHLPASLPAETIHCSADLTNSETDLDGYDVIAVGPGLGQDLWANSVMTKVLQSKIPLVIDADALNLLPEYRQELKAPAVLTPHPAEAGRLLGVATDEVQADRYSAVRALSEQYQAVVILKGNGSLVDDSITTTLIDAGNPGMAGAGMGDILTGMVAGAMAQGMPGKRAAVFAAALHAKAGDDAANVKGYGALASDVVEAAASLLAEG